LFSAGIAREGFSVHQELVFLSSFLKQRFKSIEIKSRHSYNNATPHTLSGHRLDDNIYPAL
jgi:hypothetical protein